MILYCYKSYLHTRALNNITVQRLSENRFTRENHFPGNCTGENSRATITAVIAHVRRLAFTSNQKSRGLRWEKEEGCR